MQTLPTCFRAHLLATRICPSSDDNIQNGVHRPSRLRLVAVTQSTSTSQTHDEPTQRTRSSPSQPSRLSSMSSTQMQPYPHLRFPWPPPAGPAPAPPTQYSPRRPRAAQTPLMRAARVQQVWSRRLCLALFLHTKRTAADSARRATSVGHARGGAMPCSLVCTASVKTMSASTYARQIPSKHRYVSIRAAS